MFPKGVIKMSCTKVGENRYRFECMVNRKRYSKSVKTYDMTKAEVLKKFNEWKMICEQGKYFTCEYTFGQFAKIWLENYCASFSPLVVKRYECNLKNWILPELGDINLNKITPIILDRFINKLKTSTTKYAHRKNKPLSNGTIETIYKITRTIITKAYTKDIIQTNPCDKVKLELNRAIDGEKLHYWDADTCKEALELLEKEDIEKALAVEFAVKTGLRRSEMFGLRWEDIDTENGTLNIRRSRQKVDGEMIVMPCKTLSSVREIALPISILEKLKRLSHNNSFVFGNLDYDNLTAWFRNWEKRNNLPYIRFHDLRHTHATLLLYKGIDIKTISERLGHANIGTTMNTYTHVMKELDRKCAVAIDNI